MSWRRYCRERTPWRTRWPQRELMEAINDFLKTKTDRGERQLFLRRYFWGDSIGELTVLFRHSESKVKSQLFRTRQRLRGYLEERGLLG